MNKKLFVIIVTFNGERWIERCLESVYKSTIEAIPIVLDNGSTDSTVDIIKKKFSDTRLILTGANLGFGRANNVGIKMAIEEGAEYIYLLNQDAWVDSDVFEKLINVFQTEPRYGILSPVQITANRKSVDTAFLKNSITDNYCPNLKSDLLLNKVKPVYDVLSVMAAHWMIRTEALQKVGLFSNAFPHYGEDSNLTRRMHYHNYKVGIVPGVYAVHDREYRIDSPNKRVYLHYIHVLSAFHNIYNVSIMDRIQQMIRSTVRIINTRGAGIGLKFMYIWKCLSVIPSSRRFRNLYKQGYGMD